MNKQTKNERKITQKTIMMGNCGKRKRKYIHFQCIFFNSKVQRAYLYDCMKEAWICGDGLCTECIQPKKWNAFIEMVINAITDRKTRNPNYIGIEISLWSLTFFHLQYRRICISHPSTSFSALKKLVGALKLL